MFFLKPVSNIVEKFLYTLLFSCSVVSNTLKHHGLQHAWIHNPSLSPWVCSNSCPLSLWCHPLDNDILCHLFFPLFSVFPNIRFFSKELALHIRWPNCWSFSFSISPSNEYSELISFRTDWFDLLAVQGNLKSLLQHHSTKHHFFGTQLSFWSNSLLYITTGKTISLTRRTFVSKSCPCFLIYCLRLS